MDAANVFFFLMLFFLRTVISMALLKGSCLSVIGDIAQLDTSCHFERQENKLEPNWD